MEEKKKKKRVLGAIWLSSLPANVSLPSVEISGFSLLLAFYLCCCKHHKGTLETLGCHVSIQKHWGGSSSTKVKMI